MPKSKDILQYSNPTTVQKLADKYFGKHIPVELSTRKDKKYMVKDPNGKIVHFGQMGFEDFTKMNKDGGTRRKNYLKRAKNIKGDWKQNKYSPNNLAIHLLW